MIVTDEATLRTRLVEAGIPHALAHHPRKGAYLAALLGQRLEGTETDRAAAAEAAGIDDATPRQWKHRSPAFAQAEHRARFGTAEGVPIAEDAPPEPEVVRQLRERHERAVEVCRSIGPGPWMRVRTRSAREWNENAYSDNREVAIETARELRSLGFQDVSEPPALNPYPKERARRQPIFDTSGYLWPVSLHPELHRERRG